MYQNCISGLDDAEIEKLTGIHENQRNVSELDSLLLNCDVDNTATNSKNEVQEKC